MTYTKEEIIRMIESIDFICGDVETYSTEPETKKIDVTRLGEEESSFIDHKIPSKTKILVGIIV